MSVLKANRKPSQFEVEHHAYKVRTVITDLALRQFGLKEYEENLSQTHTQDGVKIKRTVMIAILLSARSDTKLL